MHTRPNKALARSNLSIVEYKLHPKAQNRCFLALDCAEQNRQNSTAQHRTEQSRAEQNTAEQNGAEQSR